MRRVLVLMGVLFVVVPAYAQQPAYYDYVRFMEGKKEIRSGKVTIFTYPQWVQYCRGEFAGPVRKIGGRGRGDRTCLNFIDPRVANLTRTEPSSSPTARAADLPPNWNFMDANEQARWRNEQQAGRTVAQYPTNWNFMDAQQQAAWRCQRRGDLSACATASQRSVPRPLYVQPPVPRCGRACGQAWTAEDFAAADAEIARLDAEIARLRRQQTLPVYTPPIYTPYVPAPVYTPPTYSSRIGGPTFYTGGNVNGTAMTIPPFTYYNFSNGVSGTSQDIGSFSYHDFRNRHGSTLRGTSQSIGSFDYHSFSNGLRGTTQTIGDFKYTDYNDGTRCTTQTIGTYEYTTCR